jgi:hypothetical protein
MEICMRLLPAAADCRKRAPSSSGTPYCTPELSLLKPTAIAGVPAHRRADRTAAASHQAGDRYNLAIAVVNTAQALLMAGDWTPPNPT